MPRAQLVTILLAILANCSSPDSPTTPDGSSLAPDAGSAAPAVFSPCVEITDSPKTCNEICMGRGMTCQGRCQPQGSLLHESAYYTDLASCEANRSLLLGLTGCTDDGSKANSLFGATYMRCCCI
jgi:hypothetical protein